MTLPNWMLVCSGPSAARWPRSRACKVACVNGAHKLVDEPDAYGVFEITAAKEYRPVIKKFLRSPTRVFMRPNCVSRCGQSENVDKLNLVPKTFGPAELHHLHDDVVWAAEDPSVVNYGQKRAWISSGVLMAWIIAETERPEKIFVVGADGYPVNPDDRENDYAPGLSHIIDLDRDNDGRRRREEMNKRMHYGWSCITEHYGDTEFIFLETPGFGLDGTKARLADADDLRELYMGIEDK